MMSDLIQKFDESEKKKQSIQEMIDDEELVILIKLIKELQPILRFIQVKYNVVSSDFNKVLERNKGGVVLGHIENGGSYFYLLDMNTRVIKCEMIVGEYIKGAFQCKYVTHEEETTYKELLKLFGFDHIINQLKVIMEKRITENDNYFGILKKRLQLVTNIKSILEFE